MADKKKGESNREKKIVFTGGGTGGSVAPLLAIAEELAQTAEKQNFSFKFFWLGTKNGPEKEMVKELNMEFKPILAGKWRRYFSWRNFSDLAVIALAFCQSLLIIKRWRPDLVLSAGSFVSVPVVWAAWLCRVPVLIHQQDVRPGLANKLMAPAAKVVTVTFQKSLKDFGAKAIWTGNPTRAGRPPITRPAVRQKFNLSPNQAVILIIGGGTGSLALNRLVAGSLPELSRLGQVIHLTGKGKNVSQPQASKNYQAYEFLPPSLLLALLELATVVVSRCGLGVLTELSFLAKAAILIPIPNSHQEENAQVFARARAALVFKQNKLKPDKFISAVKSIIGNKQLKQQLEKNIKGLIKPQAEKEISKIILRLLYELK